MFPRDSRRRIINLQLIRNRVANGGGYDSGHGMELGHVSGGGLYDSLSSYGSGYGSYGGGGYDHGLHGGHVQHHYAPAVPVSEHIEVTKPIPIPVVKNVGKFRSSIIVPKLTLSRSNYFLLTDY